MKNCLMALASMCGEVPGGGKEVPWPAVICHRQHRWSDSKGRVDAAEHRLQQLVKSTINESTEKRFLNFAFCYVSSIWFKIQYEIEYK